MRSGAGAALWAAFACLGMGAMLLLGGRAPVGLALVASGFLLAPLALALAASGRGALTRTGVLLLLALCVLGALIGIVAALTGPAGRYLVRGAAALVASFDAWGVLLAARVLRR